MCARVSWNDLARDVKRYKREAVREIKKYHPEYGKIIDVGVSIKAHGDDLIIAYTTQHMTDNQGYWAILYA